MKAASNKPLRIDCLAREIPGRVALIAGGIDGTQELALQLCKDLHEVLESGDYRLQMQTHAEPKRAAGFRGHPMPSKLERSTCAVCRGEIRQGDPILYNRDERRAAHERCGEPTE